MDADATTTDDADASARATTTTTTRAAGGDASSSPSSPLARSRLLRRAAAVAVAVPLASSSSSSSLLLPPSASASTSARVTLAVEASKRGVSGSGSTPGSRTAIQSARLPPAPFPTAGEVYLPAGDGALQLSPMGLGTWSWGNQFVWGYEDSMDSELQRVFNMAVDAGVNVFDTADSYGTVRETDETAPRTTPFAW